MADRTIVVTGANGLIGSHLCEAFAQAGWRVRALDRPGAECAAAKAAGCEVSAAELHQPDGALFAAELARGSALVAHAAFPGADKETEAVASVRAAAAAALAAGAPLLLLSSCTVYGRPRALPCEEGEIKSPVDDHGRVRWAVEREAFLWRRTRGLVLTILRPALTYGPRQRRGLSAVLGLIALASRAGRSLWLPRRGPIVHAVHAADVANAALIVAEHGLPPLDGRAFNVADEVPLPLEELGRGLILAGGAREAGRLPYAHAPARAFLWLLRRVPFWLLWGPLNRRIARAWRRAWKGAPPTKAPILEPELLEQLTGDRYFDTQRLRLLGFAPRFPSALDGLSQLALANRARGLLPAPRPDDDR